MKRPLIIGLLITIFLSVVIGIIATFETGGSAAIVIYYGLFMFTTYLIPILIACFFFYYIQRLFHLGYTAGGMLLSFLLLLLWFEVELFAWAALAAGEGLGRIDLPFILNEFMKKNKNLWTGVVSTSMAIILINFYIEKSKKRKHVGISPGL